MSRKTNEERNNLDNELQVILQPEFIKSIGLTANGEVVRSSKKQSRLDRRLECQTQRVVKPTTATTTQQQLPKVDYKPLNTKIANDELQNDE